MIYLKDEKFEDLVKEGTCIVDFYADWCGPCKMLGPILEEISNESDIKVIKVNVDEHETLAQEFAVMSIPTIYVFKDGKEINKQVGFVPKNILLDMTK